MNGMLRKELSSNPCREIGGGGLCPPQIDDKPACGGICKGTPASASGLSLDLGVQGYTGKREGVTGSVAFNYEF